MYYCSAKPCGFCKETQKARTGLRAYFLVTAYEYLNSRWMEGSDQTVPGTHQFVHDKVGRKPSD